MSKAVSAILEDIQALDNDEIDFLFQMLDSGMWDEWDCSLITGLGMFSGPELRIAIKSAAGMAKYAETH